MIKSIDLVTIKRRKLLVVIQAAPPSTSPLVYTTVETALPPTYKVHETGLAKSSINENDSQKSQTQSKRYRIMWLALTVNKRCEVEPHNAQL